MNESDAVVVFALTIGRTVHCQQPSATGVCSSSPQSARERWTEPTTLPNESGPQQTTRGSVCRRRQGTIPRNLQSAFWLKASSAFHFLLLSDFFLKMVIPAGYPNNKKGQPNKMENERTRISLLYIREKLKLASCETVNNLRYDPAFIQNLRTRRSFEWFLAPSSSPVVSVAVATRQAQVDIAGACFFPVPPLVLGPQRAHGHVGAWRCACPCKMSGHDPFPHLCRATCESGLIGMIPATFLLSRLTIDCLLALQG